jgi:hypothetical protein
VNLAAYEESKFKDKYAISVTRLRTSDPLAGKSSFDRNLTGGKEATPSEKNALTAFSNGRAATPSPSRLVGDKRLPVE